MTGAARPPQLDVHVFTLTQNEFRLVQLYDFFPVWGFLQQSGILIFVCFLGSETRILILFQDHRLVKSV